MGYVVQAAVANILPVIFIPLRESYGLTYTQFGALVFANFASQIAADLLLSRAVDKYGTRPFVTSAQYLCVAGFALFALAPLMAPGRVFAAFLAATVVYASSGGLLELCLSPIVDAIPSGAEDSSRALSMLHSFYAWGQVGVVLLTTLMLHAGLPWQAAMLAWVAVPLANAQLFRRAPIADKAAGGGTLKIRELFRSRLFWAAVLAIAFGGAAEVIVAQYASSFMQRGLGLPKIAGDALGLCGFAAFLGLGRAVYGALGERLDLHKALAVGSLMAFAAYIAMVFSPLRALSVAAIALCGLCVSLLWPGTLAIASKKMPLAGASMFALLAGAGDIGAAGGPWAVGAATDLAMALTQPGGALSAEQLGLRAGLLLGAAFPLASLAAQIWLKRVAAAGRAGAGSSTGDGAGDGTGGGADAG
ncbi:MAG: MFS transporter [Clostridiales bacterium]|jgi:fucose permease|nr:MFS transporter [Clostridiales bacterium]